MDMQFPFVLHTLPLQAKAILDGDSFNAFVDTFGHTTIPTNVQLAVKRRSEARAKKNYEEADSLHSIIVEEGYRMIKVYGKEMLAKKYRIRLRGIDAPEGKQEYGEEAREELLRMIGNKPVIIFVSDRDQYGRMVGDVYCQGVWVNAELLRNGCAWQYLTFDRSPVFAALEREARSERRGLWAYPRPVKPWKWRRQRRSKDFFYADRSPPVFASLFRVLNIRAVVVDSVFSGFVVVCWDKCWFFRCWVG